MIKGWLNKKKSDDSISIFSNWNKRYFVFDGTNLSYYDNSINLMKPTKTIHIKNIKGIELINELTKTEFKLFTTERIYILRAMDSHDRNRWYEALNNSIKSYEDAIQQKFIDELEETKKYIQNLKKKKVNLYKN